MKTMWFKLTGIYILAIFIITPLDYFIFHRTSLFGYLIQNIFELSLGFFGFIIGYLYCKRKEIKGK